VARVCDQRPTAAGSNAAAVSAGGVLQDPVPAEGRGAGRVGARGHVRPGEPGDVGDELPAAGGGGEVAAVEQQVGPGVEGRAPRPQLAGVGPERLRREPVGAEVKPARGGVRDEADGVEAVPLPEDRGHLRDAPAGQFDHLDRPAGRGEQVAGEGVAVRHIEVDQHQLVPRAGRESGDRRGEDRRRGGDPGELVGGVGRGAEVEGGEPVRQLGQAGRGGRNDRPGGRCHERGDEGGERERNGVGGRGDVGRGARLRPVLQRLRGEDGSPGVVAVGFASDGSGDWASPTAGRRGAGAHGHSRGTGLLAGRTLLPVAHSGLPRGPRAGRRLAARPNVPAAAGRVRAGPKPGAKFLPARRQKADSPQRHRVILANGPA